MDEENKPEPKISIVETLWIGFVFILIDGAEIAIVFLGLDDFWLGDATASLIFIYLFFKGIPPFRQLIAWIIELFPWAGALPLLTAGWAWTVWADWHPSGAAAQALAVAETAALAKGGTQGIGGGGAQGGKQAAAGTSRTRVGMGGPFGVEEERAALKPQEEGMESTPGMPGANGESAAGRPPAISEEALGVPKEPIEQVKELMEKPLPQEAPKVEDVRRREML
jgi:hypothetical protein